MYARRGLATRAPIDRTVHAMLLRQLSLALYEGRDFLKAHDIALQALELDVLADVLHQDAARAALASGDIEQALAHLRAAARRSPASRRAFHWWTLGSILFIARRYREAESALLRASRWSTKDRPLYRGHLVLSQLSAGDVTCDLQQLIDELADAPCGQGYGRFVLGLLTFAAGNKRASRKYLEAFIERTTASRPSLGIALEGEVKVARETLAKIGAN